MTPGTQPCDWQRPNRSSQKLEQAWCPELGSAALPTQMFPQDAVDSSQALIGTFEG